MCCTRPWPAVEADIETWKPTVRNNKNVAVANHKKLSYQNPFLTELQSIDVRRLTGTDYLVDLYQKGSKVYSKQQYY